MFRTVLLLVSTVVLSSCAILESLVFSNVTNPFNCTETDFKCRDDHCVPLQSRCDGSNDCDDFSDEMDCDFFLLCKEPQFFRCKNQRCISRSFLCDKENDCEDFSDEQDCEDFEVQHINNSTCLKGEWQCTDMVCIPEEWVCNQEINCLDGSDETVGCSISKKDCDGFRCKNKRCISNEWRCDGHDDCGDNTDEIDCGISILSQVKCHHHGCSHDCVQLPTGLRCLCPSGYHTVDEKTCDDINECEEYGICDQKCKNTPGSYECYCEQNYLLQEDNNTCKAVDGEANMIFASKTQIRSYFLTRNLLLPLANNLKKVIGVTSDGLNIYWTDVSGQANIVKAREDGSYRQLLLTSGLELPEDIKVDWLTGNLYFTDVGKHHIGVCTNDGSHCTVLLNKDIRKPRAIVLNVDNGTMYWTDWGAPSEIAFAYMDGTNDRPFLRDDIHWPNGLALDYPNERLYWTDAKKMTLESIRLDGTERRIILQSFVKHPYAIAVFENRLYWSDWETHSIGSCDKFTGKNYHTLIKDSDDYIYGISIYHPALQKRTGNPCNPMLCSDICLLSGEAFYTCTCSEGRELTDDNHTCTRLSILSQVKCHNHGCSHDCVQLPTGLRCLCPSGYHTVDEKTCDDINECEEYGICDQKCKNTPGSYECYCEQNYLLQEDNNTCKAVDGEANMIFASITQIRSYFLTRNLLLPLANNLKKVIGVTSDGLNIYWTDVNGQANIVKAREDGSYRELLLTSGLEFPEDIKVDWLTGNLYFTDVGKHHIGVCTNDGSHCTVLLNKDIRKPRAIVLNVDNGTMYWTDWGAPSEIAFAYMDGTNDRPFLRDDIHWPNGLALDYPNERLYWTDAKKMTLESIRLDGTERRIILKSFVKHPYAIAVFENRLYWSDWETHSIGSCDKFTGKNYHTLIKDSDGYIYGISIYHPALQKRTGNPCNPMLCSDICLLSGEAFYTCTCSEGRELTDDNHTCTHVEKRKTLVLAYENILLNVELNSFGKHSVTMLPSIVNTVGAVTYDSQNHSLFISDLDTKNIVELNLNTRISRPLHLEGIGHITSMDYDPTGNNLYICDSEKLTLEVISLNTMSRKVLIHDSESEIPESVAVVPQEGFMFVGFSHKTGGQAHVDKLYMDGTGRSHYVEGGLLGPSALHYDSDSHILFYADAGYINIQYTDTDGDERRIFASARGRPVDLTTSNNDLFWTNQFSPGLYWVNKSSGENTQRITINIPTDVDKMRLTSVTPGAGGLIKSPCQNNNGNCSHLCLSSRKTVVCACPARMTLGNDNKTCIRRAECDSHEFMCALSNSCILSSLKCNGKKDCPMGEDEDDCKKPNTCHLGYFACDDGTCILEKQVCDNHFDCKDKSDEQNCNDKFKKQCAPRHFMCSDGRCLANFFKCDGISDCSDGSDESNCRSVGTCEATHFRCDSGQCIPKSWECDHEYDCDDFSDEHSECASITCATHMFTCTNGKCIDKSLHCDNSDDCGDNSDEHLCTDPVTDNGCQLNEFSCHSNQSICLHHSARCNGTADCPGGEDERSCSNCDSESFECSNKKCIPNLWLCDGADDCGDHSDENATMCLSRTFKDLQPASSSNITCENGFRCKYGACVPFDVLCDDRNDCMDESDEGGLCSKSCNILNIYCSQDCLRTPEGPKCKCREGYELMDDEHTCEDMNECEQNPLICSQICINTKGSYRCDCFDGFRLRPDKKSCKSTGPLMSLIYTLDNQIREISKKSNSLNVIFSEEMPKITTLDMSLKDNDIYFTMEDSETIQRVNVDTKMRQYIEHIGHPRKIAYDWSTGHIYYYDARSNGRTIGICSFEKMLCTSLIDIDMDKHVSELVVDSVNRVLFYSVESWWLFNSTSYVLYRTNLDGTESVELVKNTTGYITGLTNDFIKRQLFYADQYQGKIFRITYDGKQKTAIFSNLTRPTGLKYFENTLYFSTSNGDITKCQLYGERACDTFKIHAHNFGTFTLAQEGLQPAVEDPCRNNTCQYLCVSSSPRYKCLCDDGKLIETSEKCSNDKKSSLGEDISINIHSIDSPSDEDSKWGSVTLVSILLVTLGIILAIVVLIVYAKKKHTGHFNTSLTNYKPTYTKNADGTEKAILTTGQHDYTNLPPYDRPNELES